MRALVTGGAGFLGSHLCDWLLNAGDEVVALDNLVTGNLRNIAHLSDNPRFQFVEANICEGVPVEGRFDRVWHLASPASPIDYVELPFETLHVGSFGTQKALERAEADGARFFLASTSEVYGDPEVHPQVESYWGNVNPIGPRSVYDEAKRYAEALTMAFSRYKGVEVRIVRIFNTYGPRMRPNDGRVIPAFASQALAGKPLTVFGDGSQTRSFCFVRDLIRGFHLLMESDVEGPCNLGNPDEMDMNRLAERINAVTNNPGGVVFRPLPKDDPTRRRPNISRAQERLGWSPEVSFDDGIAMTLEYFQTLCGGNA